MSQDEEGELRRRQSRRPARNPEADRDGFADAGRGRVPGKATLTERLPPAHPAAVAVRAVRAAHGAATRVEAWGVELSRGIASADYLESGRLSFEIRSALRRAESDLDQLEQTDPARAAAIVDQIEAARERLIALRRELALLLCAAPEIEKPGAGSEHAERAWVAGRGGARSLVPRAADPAPAYHAADVLAGPYVVGLQSARQPADVTASSATTERDVLAANRRGELAGDRFAMVARLWQRDVAELAPRVGLSDAAVHADETARSVTEREGARGVALDGVIYLHPDRIDAGTATGREVLAHELVHVAQSRLSSAEADRDDAEREADHLASRVVRGETIAPRLRIDLSRGAADDHAKRARHGRDVIAKAEQILAAAEALVDEIRAVLDAAREDGRGTGVAAPLVEKLASFLVAAEAMALSDPTLPEARKRELPRVLDRIEHLKNETKRYQVDHHGDSTLARANGEREPAPRRSARARIEPSDVATVGSMYEALLAATAAATYGDRDRARALYDAALERFNQLRYADESVAFLQSLGDSRTFWDQALAESGAALIAFRQALYRGHAPMMVLQRKRFQISAAILLVLNDEIDGDESYELAIVAAAAKNRTLQVLLPIVIAGGIVHAPALLTWALLNPVAATNLLEAAIAVGPAILAAGGVFPWILSIADDPAALADVLGILAGGGGRGGGRRSPERRPHKPMTPDVAPPAVRDTVDAPPASPRKRVAKVAGDVVDRGGAAVEAVAGAARGDDVPAVAGRDAPDGRAPTIGERYDRALKQRLDRRARKQAAREARDHGVYEGHASEAAAITGELVRRGGKVAHSITDGFTGDVLTAIDLPNGRRVFILGRGTGAPRKTHPRDAARAKKLRRDAAAARARNAQRDAAVADRLAGVPRDPDGNVLHLFDRVHVGGGTAGVLNHATRRASANEITIADRPEPWAHRDVKMGQPPGELEGAAGGPWANRHGDLVTEPTDYVHSSVHADVLALTADKATLGVAYGYRLVGVQTGRFDDIVPGARVRLTVETEGRIVHLYGKTADLTVGPGPSRRLDTHQLAETGGAKRDGYTRTEIDAAKQNEAVLVASNRLVYGDKHLEQPPRGGRALVSGGSATGGWSTVAIARAGGEVEWIARGRGANERPRVPSSKAEVDRIARELERTDLSADERAYLTRRMAEENAFGDADVARNQDAFADPRIKRSVKQIAQLTPSESVTSGPGAGESGKVVVRFDDGSVDVFDYVVVVHGPDPRAAGGIVDATKDLGVLVPTMRDNQVVALQSQDNAVRILGASTWSSGWDTQRIGRTPDEYKDWKKAGGDQAGDLPDYSRGIPDSIAMAMRSIVAANAKKKD